jgi:lipopolysaccharide export system ATP-binding protein
VPDLFAWFRHKGGSSRNATVGGRRSIVRPVSGPVFTGRVETMNLPRNPPPPGRDPRARQEVRQDPRPDPRPDPRLDPHPDQRAEARYDQRQAARQDPRQEVREEPPPDPRPDPRAEARQRQAARQDPRQEPRTDPRRDVRQENRQETRQATRQQTRQEARQQPRHDQQAEQDWYDARDALAHQQQQAIAHNGDARRQPILQGYLAAHGVERSFVGRKVVKGVSLYVRRGEAVGLLGPNGAGKTTVFYMITGLITADRGRIELDGHDVTGLPMYQRARLGIGYLPQEASIFRGLNVEQNIRAVLEVTEPSRKRREYDLDALLEEFNITRLRKTPSIALSGGERRRVEIARALATRPNYMLLDEPFAGIDPIAVGDIQALVRHLTQRGIGVLITDHNVRETLGLTDRAYIIYSGEVLKEGRAEDIVNNPDVRRLYLGEDFSM